MKSGNPLEIFRKSDAGMHLLQTLLSVGLFGHLLRDMTDREVGDTVSQNPLLVEIMNSIACFSASLWEFSPEGKLKTSVRSMSLNEVVESFGRNHAAALDGEDGGE